VIGQVTFFEKNTVSNHCLSCLNRILTITCTRSLQYFVRKLRICMV